MNISDPKTLFGGSAIIAAVMAGWSQVRYWLGRVTSLLVVTVELTDYSVPASYLFKYGRTGRFDVKTYSLHGVEYVRSKQRYQNVGMEVLGNGNKIFWIGWKPIWYATSPASKPTSGPNLSFIRGTFDAEKLVIEMLDTFNNLAGQRESSRFGVFRVFGMRQNAAYQRSSGNSGAPASGSDSNISAAGSTKPSFPGCFRLLKYKPDEIGMEKFDTSQLELLALPEAASDMLREIKWWRDNRKWYHDKNLPWQRGWLLHGPPGTGKTSLVRAIGHDLMLPVYVYDLSSLSNEEMTNFWKTMLSNSPCIALIEDIDGSFDGRKNITGEQGGGLTFDCLLNCIGGIERASGVFIVVTTNKPETLDPALGVVRDHGGGDTSDVAARPGRIDRVLYLGPLDDTQRLKLATRILADCPEEISAVVKRGHRDTGAQFQERCSQLALIHLNRTVKSKL